MALPTPAKRTPRELSLTGRIHQFGSRRVMAAAAASASSIFANRATHVGPLTDMRVSSEAGAAASAARISPITGSSAIAGASRSFRRASA
jgi:hypothetical protein